MPQSASRREHAYTARVARVCDRLRSMFDHVAEEPVPEPLNDLADRLDVALERGELQHGERR